MLGRLPRYLLSQTTVMYVLGVAGFCLLLSIDFLALWAEYLLEHQASPATVARLMLYRLPWFLHLALPVAVVLAVLLTTGRMARDSELKAAYGMGVNPLSLLTPLLLFGLIISLISVVNNGYLEPVAEKRYNDLVDSFFYTRPPNEVQTNAAFSIPDTGIYYAARIRSDRNDDDLAELTGVLVMRPDGTTVTAPRGTWNSAERRWTLEAAQQHRTGEAPVPAGEVVLPFDLGAAVGQALQNRETLSLPVLWERIQTLRAAGGNVRDLTFSLHRRIADAFSATVFVLFAGVLGLGLHGRAAGFAWTVVLLVGFWATWTLAGNLFETGVLSGAAAAWLTPAAVGAVGLLVSAWRLRA